MFQFLYIFGPASITYLLIHRILGKDTVHYFNGMIELICYAMLNTAGTTVVLAAFNSISIALTPLMPNGIENARFCGFAFAFSTLIAVIIGVVISIIRKYIDVAIEIELQEKKENYGSEKDN